MALGSVLDRLELDCAELELELGLVGPDSEGPHLLATVHGLRIGGERTATLDLREAEVGELRSPTWLLSGAPQASLVFAAPGPDRALRLAFVGEGISSLIGMAADEFAYTPAAAVMLARAEAILRMPDLPDDSPLLDLALADSRWGGRRLVCRLFKGTTASGDVAVGFWLSEPQRTVPHAHARHVDGLLRLLRISGVLLEHPPQKEGLARIADEIASTPGLRRAAIGRLDNGRPRLQVIARAGNNQDAVGPAEIPLSATQGACAIAIGERRLIADWSAAPAGLKLYAPIEAADRLLGVLAVEADPDLAVDGWQEELLGSYADYVAAFMAGQPARPRALRGPPQPKPDEIDIAGLLTARQQDVLYLLVEGGASNREIARSLATTEATVKVHMRAILSAIKVTSRAEAIQLVYQRAPGWLARMRQRHELAPPPGRAPRE
ncbi:MAG TPA: LuxR C-terminal-related transcriptional regulator [Geminicoccaceae bacterium]|nr:LuxR C-terminal-related transcriptional regulator [Geminicoccus sp.]HMU50733.1 LuxR C-terminal-related transcriptional regulator [Geminicoccaceae bacterium]